MDPITIALLASTAIGGIGSIMGGNEAARANDLNAQISMLNYYQQQAAQRRAQGEAMRQQSEAKLGTTDASGNRTYFVPGVGWTTELSPDQRALLEGTEEEQLRSLRDDTARAETSRGRDDTRRGQEDQLASEFLRQLQTVQRPDEGALRQLFLARGAEQRNRAADAAGEMVARQAIRAGGGANAAELTQGARAASDAASARQAGVDATLAAREEADREYASDTDRASKLYDYFRRSSTSGGAPVQGITPQGPQTRSTGAADQMLLSIFQQGAPQMDYQSPNNAWAGTLTDLGKLGMSAYNTHRQGQLDQAVLDRWRSNAGGIM